jgi:hypothetical protein
MQTEGIAEAIRNAIQRRLATFREATVDVVAGGSRAVQKAHARNPFYFDPDTRAVIRDRVHEAMQRDGGLTRDDLNAIGRLMVTGIESHFEAQRNPGGSTFRELTEEYAKAKRKKFGDKPILEATGELRNSMGVRVDVR